VCGGWIALSHERGQPQYARDEYDTHLTYPLPPADVPLTVSCVVDAAPLCAPLTITDGSEYDSSPSSDRSTPIAATAAQHASAVVLQRRWRTWMVRMGFLMSSCERERARDVLSHTQTSITMRLRALGVELPRLEICRIAAGLSPMPAAPSPPPAALLPEAPAPPRPASPHPPSPLADDDDDWYAHEWSPPRRLSPPPSPPPAPPSDVGAMSLVAIPDPSDLSAGVPWIYHTDAGYVRSDTGAAVDDDEMEYWQQAAHVLTDFDQYPQGLPYVSDRRRAPMSERERRETSYGYVRPTGVNMVAYFPATGWCHYRAGHPS